jgi:hypothetical protein
MLTRDWLTAILAAVFLMALGVAMTFGWVAIYSHVIDPGHPVEVYQAYADRNAPWISVYASPPLWFIAGWLIGRGREPSRAIDTAFGAGFVYAVLDIAIIGAMGAFWPLIGIILISITTKTLAAAAGAWLRAH